MAWQKRQIEGRVDGVIPRVYHERKPDPPDPLLVCHVWQDVHLAGRRDVFSPRIVLFGCGHARQAFEETLFACGVVDQLGTDFLCGLEGNVPVLVSNRMT